MLSIEIPKGLGVIFFAFINICKKGGHIKQEYLSSFFANGTNTFTSFFSSFESSAF